MSAVRYIGTAGWALPKAVVGAIGSEGSTLARYASLFNGVEINSSFYRPHKRTTYKRWASSVPAGFRFAVKAPRQITHEHRLIATTALMDPFLEQIRELGAKLGPVLVQLPPSLAFSDELAAEFFGAWRQRFGGPTVCEPRHASWFSEAADQCLVDHRIIRAAADPALCAAAALPGGAEDGTYIRLHGSPILYESPYGAERLKNWVLPLTTDTRTQTTWCIFDNTKFGAATADALSLKALAASS